MLRNVMAQRAETDTSVVVRPAGPDDVEGLLALHQRVFEQPLSRAQWEWKRGWKHGSGSDASNVWLAEKDGRILAQYAGIPTRVRHRGVDTRAIVSVDTMTDPAFRRIGLLGQLGTACYRHWREAGFAFVMGLPNEQWGSRAAALGWTKITELRWWVRWLDPISLCAARIGLARSRPEARVAVGSAREGDGAKDLRPIHDAAVLDDIWPRIADEGIVRDGPWFSWRYLEAEPRWSVLGLWRGERICGAAAFRRRSEAAQPTSGLIGEVVALDRRARRELLAGACRRLREAGCVRAALLVQPGTDLEPAALASRFLPRRSPFTVEAVDLGGDLPRAARFQGGDFDVV
jgi:hypothetical protein